MRHLFMGPSSALCADSESVGTRPCNARLHNMMEVEAENIAYGVIQVCLTFYILTTTQCPYTEPLCHWFTQQVEGRRWKLQLPEHLLSGDFNYS
jgi:hypothetical protein